ncbi:MAG TPA: hypothetical protein PKN70_01540 [Smithellaceae bacterium]|nr:hypothetical protein [Smithellaceae bacterium]HQM44548.1 hypothetical protein [Smithellaceae bacterium]
MATPYADLHAGSFFFCHMRIRLGEKAPDITLSQLKLLIGAVLSMKVFDFHDLIELVSWTQIKKHRVYISHRKRKLGEFEKIIYVSL